jgi:hypothetical protein
MMNLPIRYFNIEGLSVYTYAKLHYLSFFPNIDDTCRNHKFIMFVYIFFKKIAASVLLMARP